MSDMSAVRIGMLKAMPAKWDVESNWAMFVAQFEAHGRDVDVAHPSRQPDFSPSEED